jgi:hypothetical protein
MIILECILFIWIFTIMCCIVRIKCCGGENNEEENTLLERDLDDILISETDKKNKHLKNNI